jgi:hypothetical protein
MDSIKLYISLIGICIPNRCWGQKDKIKKVYKDGKEKLDEMLDLKKIVKNIRTVMTLLKHSFLTKDVKNRI